MNPQPQQKAPLDLKPEPKRSVTTLKGIFFRDSINDLGGAMSVAIGARGIETLKPGSISALGQPAVADDDGERASDGILVVQRIREPSGKSLIRTVLVPWSNILFTQFEDVTEATPAA